MEDSQSDTTDTFITSAQISFASIESANIAFSIASSQIFQLSSHQISRLNAFVFSIILQECVDKLIILGKMLDLPDVKIELFYKPIETICKRDEDKTINAVYRQFDNIMLDKINFQKVRTFIEVLLKKLIRTLRIDSKYDILWRVIEDYDMTMLETNKLFGRVSEKQNDLTKLEEEKKMLQENHIQQMQCLNEEISQLKDEIINTTNENVLKLKYMTSWEGSRAEMNTNVYTTEEESYTEIIETYTFEAMKEERVHQEITYYLDEYETELRKEIAIWSDKYDIDLEAKENEIMVIKNKITQQKEDYNLLQLAMEKRQEAIDNWLAYKEKKWRKEIELFCLTRAAKKIQCWWRITMQKLHLGPYKKKKGKKGSAKNKRGKKLPNKK